MNDFVRLGLPPPPEGTIGQRLFCVSSETVYPWWCPRWLYWRLPSPALRWVSRFLGHKPRYVELAWQEFMESQPTLPGWTVVTKNFERDEPFGPEFF